MSNKLVSNGSRQEGNANKYQRSEKKKVEHMHPGSGPMYVPYAPVTYHTAIIFMLAVFFIFILVLGYINQRPVGYITKYTGDCLLKLSSTYGAIECL